MFPLQHLCMRRVVPRTSLLTLPAWSSSANILFSSKRLVGSSTPLDSLHPSKVPQFGTRRRRQEKAEAQGAQPANTPAVIPDNEARDICFEYYDFLERPLFVSSWSEFLSELRRFEFSWALAPGSGASYVFSITEHTTGGDEKLFEVRGNSTKCVPIAEFFDCCGQLIEGRKTEAEINFVDDNGRKFVLQVFAKTRLSGSKNSLPREPPILPVIAQFNSVGTLVDLKLMDCATGLASPIFHEISLQTLCYLFLTSIPPFLKRKDIGVRNADLISKDQMSHFRFAWCFIRRESRMTAVDMTELDALLPV